MTEEPKLIFLGVVDAADTGVFSVPNLYGPVEDIQAAIEAAETAKREAAKRESEFLRREFLGKKAGDK